MKISIVIPCYNEEKSIAYFYEQLNSYLRKEIKLISENIIEVIFVNDGSKDNTWLEISECCKNNQCVAITIKGVNFSKNFGKESAIIAGLKVSTGDCIITIDADLQHPIEIIPKMYENWKLGFKIVDGVKMDRGNESLFHKKMSSLFHGIASRAVKFDMKNSSDYKLIDREVADLILKLPEKHIFYRGLTSWIGFEHTEVEYSVKDRIYGETKWSSLSLINYAIKNISSFSSAPLSIITYIGVIFLIFSFIFAIYTIFSFFYGNPVSGYSTLVILILLIGSFNMIALGIIGYYIKKIFDQVQSRPVFIISDIISDKGEI